MEGVERRRDVLHVRLLDAGVAADPERPVGDLVCHLQVTRDPVRGTYRGRVIGAHLEAADTALIARDFRAGLAHAQAVVRLDRLSERAHRTEMLALYAMGRTHEALEAYRRLRSLLVGELGLEPNVETRSLEAAILRQDEVSELLPRPSREM